MTMDGVCSNSSIQPTVWIQLNFNCKDCCLRVFTRRAPSSIRNEFSLSAAQTLRGRLATRSHCSQRKTFWGRVHSIALCDTKRRESFLEGQCHWLGKKQLGFFVVVNIYSARIPNSCKASKRVLRKSTFILNKNNRSANILKLI